MPWVTGDVSQLQNLCLHTTNKEVTQLLKYFRCLFTLRFKSKTSVNNYILVLSLPTKALNYYSDHHLLNHLNWPAGSTSNLFLSCETPPLPGAPPAHENFSRSLPLRILHANRGETRPDAHPSALWIFIVRQNSSLYLRVQ